MAESNSLHLHHQAVANLVHDLTLLLSVTGSQISAGSLATGLMAGACAIVVRTWDPSQPFEHLAKGWEELLAITREQLQEEWEKVTREATEGRPR